MASQKVLWRPYSSFKAFIEANKANFFGRWEPDFNKSLFNQLKLKKNLSLSQRQAIVRTSWPEVFCKKGVLLQNSQENTCASVSFWIKLQACNFSKKETLAQVLFREFCGISKNTFSYRTPPVATSVLQTHLKKRER